MFPWKTRPNRYELTCKTENWQSSLIVLFADISLDLQQQNANEALNLISLQTTHSWNGSTNQSSTCIQSSRVRINSPCASSVLRILPNGIVFNYCSGKCFKAYLFVSPPFFCCCLFVSESSNVGLAIVNIRLPGLWLDSTILDHGDRMEAVLLSDIAIISILPAVSIQVNFESAPKFVLELPLLLNIANDPTPPPPPPRPSRMQDANGDNNHNQSNTDASDQVNVPPSIELDNHHPVGSKRESNPLESDTKEILQTHQINNHHSSDHRPGPVGMQNGFASADSASLTSQFVLSSEIGCGRMVFSRSGGAHHRPM